MRTLTKGEHYNYKPLSLLASVQHRKREDNLSEKDNKCNFNFIHNRALINPMDGVNIAYQQIHCLESIFESEGRGKLISPFSIFFSILSLDLRKFSSDFRL